MKRKAKSKQKKEEIIYLASQSPRRKELLGKMKLSFCVVSSNYHEKKIPEAGAEQTAMWHACQKARNAKIPLGARLVLGADTLVVLEDQIMGKPKNLKEAERMLAQLSGKCHYVVTGVSLIDHATHVILTGYTRTAVYFKKLSSKAIKEYFKKVNPLDKAGGYAIQEGPKLVRKIEGSYTNVIGLPVELVKQLLKDACHSRESGNPGSF